VATTLLGLDGNPWTPRDMDSTGNNFVTVRCKVSLSGNYTTNGDSLDFSAIASYVPTNAVPLQITPTEQGLAATPSLSAAGGFAAIIQNPVPTLKNYLLKLFKNSAGNTAEYPNGAYSADALTDNLQLEITWRKMAL
jgi:hypothetical protein